MRTSLSRSMGVSVLILCTTYEDSGTGEDTDMFVRIHRFMLLRRMNGSKALFDIHRSSFYGPKAIAVDAKNVRAAVSFEERRTAGDPKSSFCYVRVIAFCELRSFPNAVVGVARTRNKQAKRRAVLLLRLFRR